MLDRNLDGRLALNAESVRVKTVLQRIQKILARAGIASRRKAEELIAQGRVTINGAIARIGQSADTDKDSILCDGKPVRGERFVYILLNKPLNIITSVSDPLGRKTVRDLVRAKERIFPVGRLDRNATGLVLLTNDGALANRMMHPRYETAKKYAATLSSPVTPALLERLRKGVVVDDRLVRVNDVEQRGPNLIELSIHEGRKHIVKKLFVKLGTHVDALERVAIGPLLLGKLKPGAWRTLTDKEVRKLRQALAL